MKICQTNKKLPKYLEHDYRCGTYWRVTLLEGGTFFKVGTIIEIRLCYYFFPSNNKLLIMIIIIGNTAWILGIKIY